MITDFAGWRVTPHRPDVVSGVIARVKVRASWINFDNEEVIKSPHRLGDKLKMLMSQDTKRKQYFNLLLRHLVQTELRGSSGRTGRYYCIPRAAGTAAGATGHVALIRAKAADRCTSTRAGSRNGSWRTKVTKSAP